MADTILKKLSVNFTALTENSQWFEPFNQATFFNYDTTNKVVINQGLILPPAVLSGSIVYPTSFTVALNALEVNTTNFSFDFQGSTSINLHVVYTQYLGISL